MDKIVDYLKQLNLSDAEAKLYLRLLQTGPTSVRDLAQTVDIKRTTAYFYIDQLVEKGLIMKLVKGSKKLVAANEPENLKALVDAQISSAKTVEKNLPSILKELRVVLPHNSGIEAAEISYYKGIHGAKKMYDNALKGSELRLYVNLAELERLLMPNTVGVDYNMFDLALAKNPKLKIYEILGDTPDLVKNFNLNQSAQGNRYYFKYMYAHVKLTAPGILMYNNNVAIVNGIKGQVTTVVLHNIDYYTNSVRLFDYIWSTLP